MFLRVLDTLTICCQFSSLHLFLKVRSCNNYCFGERFVCSALVQCMMFAISIFKFSGSNPRKIKVSKFSEVLELRVGRVERVR